MSKLQQQSSATIETWNTEKLSPITVTTLKILTSFFCQCLVTIYCKLLADRDCVYIISCIRQGPTNLFRLSSAIIFWDHLGTHKTWTWQRLSVINTFPRYFKDKLMQILFSFSNRIKNKCLSKFKLYNYCSLISQDCSIRFYTIQFQLQISMVNEKEPLITSLSTDSDQLIWIYTSDVIKASFSYDHTNLFTGKPSIFILQPD